MVFMGMGEPMLNMKEVLEAHRCLNKVYQVRAKYIFYLHNHFVYFLSKKSCYRLFKPFCGT